MTYEDLLQDTPKKERKFKFRGEVIVEKRSAWVVSPNYEGFKDPNTPSRSLYVPAKLFPDINKALREMIGESIVVSFSAKDGKDLMKELKTMNVTAINSKMIKNLRLHLDKEDV